MVQRGKFFCTMSQPQDLSLFPVYCGTRTDIDLSYSSLCYAAFWFLVICRMFVGVGEASFVALASPFIGEVFIDIFFS